MFVGIDLGTTNSLVACFNKETNEPELIANAHGEFLTPSAVTLLDDSSLAIGKVACERLTTHPDHTVANFKRYMGSDKSFTLDGKKYSAPDLSSLVLKQLIDDVEKATGERPDEAVITVPAYFSDIQRESTKLAAQLAGLKKVRLLNEPTAAALAYSIHDRDEELTLFVVDLGGGTFDVSIIEKFEGVMEIHASGGDNFLGGEDFTEVITQELMKQVNPSTWQKGSFPQKLYSFSERLKKELSNKESLTTSIKIKDKSYEISLVRSEVERASHSLIERMRKPIERALRDSKLKTADISHVVLVGGATRMPIIKKMVGSMFGQFPLIKIDPDTVVARGAAVQAMLIKDNRGFEDRILTDVCPYSLGIEVVEEIASGREAGVFSPIIERNQAIPTSRMQTYSPVSPRQKKMELHVYQGESRWVKDNILIGKVLIDIEKQPSNEEVFEVRFTYDVSGLLEVEVKALSTGTISKSVIQKENSTITEREIKARFEELSQLKIHPRESEENRYLYARMERMYEECLGELRNHISYLISQFTAVLEEQDPEKIQAFREELVEELDRLDRDWL